MGEQERRKHILIHMIHQNNALVRQLLKVRWEQRSAHTKGLDNSLGEIQVMVFIAERVLMSKLQSVTNALMKCGIRALLGTDGDAAVQEWRGGSEKSQTNLVNSHAEKVKTRAAWSWERFHFKHWSEGACVLSNKARGSSAFPSPSGWECSAPISPFDSVTQVTYRQRERSLTPSTTTRINTGFPLIRHADIPIACIDHVQLPPAVRTCHCHLALGQNLLPVSRDMSFCVVLVLFSLYWFSAQCLFALQDPKGPSKGSVLLQREVQVANMKFVICTALKRQHQFPQLLMESEINPSKANKEKTVKIKAWSTLGKHTSKFHFDDT